MNDRFLRACRREPVDCTPVWFMRQAVRYMAEYRALRAKHTLLEICKNPELATEVTLQPLRLGVDAAILFADILLPLEPMGAPFEFAKGEGPVIHEPIARADQIEKLRVIEPEEGLGYVMDAIRVIKKELASRGPK
jgi:uroporphyrinogen decarboxylase